MEGLTLDRHKVVPCFSKEELTEKEQAEYPWDTDSEDIYFRYLGTLYSNQDFLWYSNNSDWDGILSETFFSGVFIKFEEDYETVHCVRYFS